MDLQSKSLKDLVEIYNSLYPPKLVKRFASRAAAIKRIRGLLPGKQSRVGIIRSMFITQRECAREEIMAKTGWDAKNVQSAMNILKNRKRTKAPLITVYDRHRMVFSLIKTG